MSERTWHHTYDRSSSAYIDGVRDFLQAALRFARESDGHIRCPCRDCLNIEWHPIEVIQRHLFRRGMAWGYNRWIYHGELPASVGESNMVEISNVDDNVQINEKTFEDNVDYQMLEDMARDQEDNRDDDLESEEVGDEVDSNDWSDLFEDAIYKTRPEINTKNRDKLPYPYTGGSKSFMSQKEKRKLGEIDLFEHLHRHRGSSNDWVNDTTREKHARMVQKKDEFMQQSQESGEEPESELQILTDVLGYKSGYTCGMGYGGLKPPSRRVGRNANERPLDNSLAEIHDLKVKNQDLRRTVTELSQKVDQLINNQRPCNPFGFMLPYGYMGLGSYPWGQIGGSSNSSPQLMPSMHGGSPGQLQSSTGQFHPIFPQPQMQKGSPSRQGIMQPPEQIERGQEEGVHGPRAERSFRHY